MLKTLRQVHLYLGVFFAPSIIFFAFTGALQTFSLHEDHSGKPGIPWVTALAEVHKNQRVPNTWMGESPQEKQKNEKPKNNAGTALPPKRESAPPDGDAQPAGKAVGKGNTAENPDATKVPERRAESTRESKPQGSPPKRRPKSVPLKVFVALMAIGLVITSLIGVYMAFKYSRGPALICGLLIAGNALPALLLYL